MKKQSLISAFDTLLGPPIADEIPEGFFSIEQLAKHHGVTESRMNHRLLELHKLGKCDRQQFRNENGRACWFYRVK